MLGLHVLRHTNTEAAMIPKYPYRVEVTTKTPSGSYDKRTKNFELLPAAMSYRDKCMGKRLVVNVTVAMVLDETGAMLRPESHGG